MPLPLLPILLIGGAVAVAAAVGAAKGSGGAGVGELPFNYAAGKEKWRNSDWEALVDQLQIDLGDDPEMIARAAAADVFPDHDWPELANNSLGLMWKLIKNDVWGYLGIEEMPFPAG